LRVGAECVDCGDETSALCPRCGRCEICCGCYDDYSADELGLDPEEGYD